MQVEIIGITSYPGQEGGAEALLEHAGRACYRSAAKGQPGRFLQARVREGHESLIEHASVTFEISGISRACSHQLVRHRLASYSQESQRYVDMSDPEFVVPPSIAADPQAQYNNLQELVNEIGRLNKAMREAADNLEFEQAAELRDRLRKLQELELQLR